MIYLLSYLFIEIMVSTQFASSLGGLLTFVEVVVSAMLGGAFIRRTPMRMMEAMQSLRENSHENNHLKLLPIMSVAGGILLIMPGFFSDILGILLQFNFSASLLLKITKNKQHTRYNNHYETKFEIKTKPKSKKKEDDVIDVEIIEHDNNK
ncbi:MAG: FxsA family protein [Gimesia sp.]